MASKKEMDQDKCDNQEINSQENPNSDKSFEDKEMEAFNELDKEVSGLSILL